MIISYLDPWDILWYHYVHTWPSAKYVHTVQPHAISESL